MRILTVAALFVLGFTTASIAANDGPWCYRDFGGPQYTNCPYHSIRECLTAAGILGGVCERNHGPAPEAQKKDKRKAQSR
ncbi:MAG TPA: DUF3551 domain-containing protein [Pseudolabrys sp.]|nr:DUF3551 domain-containing protein [Pseudolabrys sp.]